MGISHAFRKIVRDIDGYAHKPILVRICITAPETSRGLNRLTGAYCPLPTASCKLWAGGCKLTIYFTCSSNHPSTVLYHNWLFWGFNTQ